MGSWREISGRHPHNNNNSSNKMLTALFPIGISNKKSMMFTQMMSLEVADSRGVYAAFLVYLDLLEVRNWHEVSFTGLAEFQLVCLHGREKETEPLQVVVPTPAHVSFSHERLREIMNSTRTVLAKPDSPLSITLAIVETDSTIVYYTLTDGFVMPDPPDSPEDADSKQGRKKRKRLRR
ncbi:tRNA-splicing endonuclease subunit Sen15 isoform X2 [Candoia aspera]|uniref:tRNA-splicing endonuclease subunit Sen15 isoform X2 n=1 Tax=Candoia aspera TaxID=51853 RepID=UPI002FD7DEA9